MLPVSTLVLQVEIIADKNTGKPRGFAFISFDDYDPVDKCVLQKSHQIHNYRCDVKKALSKEEMAKVKLILSCLSKLSSFGIFKI